MRFETRDEMWRLGIASYATVCSRGRSNWYPYKWLRYLSQELLPEILKKDARVIINAPPRHGKSEFCSFWLPLWYIDNNPDKRVIICSYGADYAHVYGRRIRDELDTNPLCWTRLKRDSKSVGSWETVNGGGIVSAGVDGPITGRGGHLLIIDDPHKNFDEAMSETYRKHVVDWYKYTLYSRQEPGASIVLIQTRWHDDDLTGYLLKEQKSHPEIADKWKVISLPAIAETGDLLKRQEGDALCPERYPVVDLLRKKHVLGSYMFSGQFQQSPVPMGGGMIKKDWFQLYREIPEKPDEWIQSWDLTFKSDGTSYVAGQVWCRKHANYFLVDRIKEKLEFVDQLRKITNMTRKWPLAIKKLIEDAADAQAVKSTLKNEIPGIVLIKPRGSKEARLANVSGIIESGNVYLPADAIWRDDYVAEITTFPYAANDDEVDSTTQALTYFLKNTNNSTDIRLPQSGYRESPWSMIHGTA